MFVDVLSLENNYSFVYNNPGTWIDFIAGFSNLETFCSTATQNGHTFSTIKTRLYLGLTCNRMIRGGIRLYS